MMSDEREQTCQSPRGVLRNAGTTHDTSSAPLNPHCHGADELEPDQHSFACASRAIDAREGKGEALLDEAIFEATRLSSTAANGQTDKRQRSSKE